jgi:hypothetical protein
MLRPQAFARPDAARDTVQSFRWQTLAELLVANPPPDLLSTMRGAG